MPVPFCLAGRMKSRCCVGGDRGLGGLVVRGLRASGGVSRPTARRPPGSRRGAFIASARGMWVREGWACANRAGVGKPSAARMEKLGFPRASEGQDANPVRHGCCRLVESAFCVGRGCPCPLAGRSLRPSRPPFTACPLRSGIHACACFPSPLEGTGNPSRDSGSQTLDRAAANPTGRGDRGCASADYFRVLMKDSSSLRLARPMR